MLSFLKASVTHCSFPFPLYKIPSWYTWSFHSLIGSNYILSIKNERQREIQFKLLALRVHCFLIFSADSNSPCNYVSVVANLTSLSESFYKAIIVQTVPWFGTVSFLCKMILLLFDLSLNQRQMQTSMLPCLQNACIPYDLLFMWRDLQFKLQTLCRQWFIRKGTLKVLFQGHLFEEITAHEKHTIYFSVYFPISTKINCGI